MKTKKMKVSHRERRMRTGGRFLWAAALLAGLVADPFGAQSASQAQTPPPNKKRAINGRYRAM
ncbi:hypothetical protein [Alistipes timonensis]|nr:hypothetical protein [Alistipes timonensis]